MKKNSKSSEGVNYMRVGYLVVMVSIFVVLSDIAYGFEISNRLIGRPLTKASCDIDGCLHQKLTEDEQGKYEMVITKAGDDYIWTSREGKLLHHSVSGAYDWYLNMEGSGYIKTTDINGHCEYTEHLTLGLQTITYWGICESS